MSVTGFPFAVHISPDSKVSCKEREYVYTRRFVFFHPVVCLINASALQTCCSNQDDLIVQLKEDPSTEQYMPPGGTH